MNRLLKLYESDGAIYQINVNILFHNFCYTVNRQRIETLLITLAMLQHWKRWKDKAAGLSGLVAEMIQATGDIGTQWTWDLCNGIMKKDASQRTGSQVWYYQFPKGNGIQWSVNLTQELNCWNMLCRIVGGGKDPTPLHSTYRAGR